MFIDEKKIIEGNESEDVAHLALVEDRVSDSILADILKDNDIPFPKVHAVLFKFRTAENSCRKRNAFHR